jgi:hypothetical protein
MPDCKLPIRSSLQQLKSLLSTALPHILRHLHCLHSAARSQIYLTCAVQDVSFFGVFMALFHLVLYSSIGCFLVTPAIYLVSAVFPFPFSCRLIWFWSWVFTLGNPLSFSSGFVCWTQAWGVLVCHWSIEHSLS